MEESRPYRPHKKPRICQRCRTHGTEELSTSEHRGNCPWKDCSCPKCLTIQRENLRHSEYNRRRRAERREKAHYENTSLYLAPPPHHHHHHHMALQSPHTAHPPPPGAGQPMYVVVADNQGPAGTSAGAASSPYAVSHHMQPTTRGYTIQPPLTPHHAASAYMPRPPMSAPPHHQAPTVAASMYPQPAHTSPTGRTPGVGPVSFYTPGRSHHQPPPQVTLGRPYAAGAYHQPRYISASSSQQQQQQVEGPAVAVNAAKRYHSPDPIELAEQSPSEPPLKLARRPPLSGSEDNDVFEEANGIHGRGSPHEMPAPPLRQQISRSSSSEPPISLGDSTSESPDAGPPQTSPPPLQSSEYRSPAAGETAGQLYTKAGESGSAIKAMVPMVAAPSNLSSAASMRATGGASTGETQLPWAVSERIAAVTARNLVDLQDRNPHVHHRICYFYLASCAGDVQKAHQELQKSDAASGSSSNSSSDSTCSATSDIEVDDMESQRHRLVMQSKFGFRLGRKGQQSEKVRDTWSSSCSSPESPAAVARVDSCRGARRRCRHCRTWFSVQETNNTGFCSKHKPAYSAK